MSSPKVSIVCPIHDMANGDKFLWRLVNSLTEQTFTDWELIITKEGKMAENTNAGIKRARGEYIKILYLDDYFSHKDSLKMMVDLMHPYQNWLVVGTDDHNFPLYLENPKIGENNLGSPSAIIFRNEFEDSLLFDEKMDWLLDWDFYNRMFTRHSYPGLISGNHITIGKHDGQMTHILTDEQKLAEHEYMKHKYE